MSQEALNRRDFLKLLGGGILVLSLGGTTNAQEESGGRVRRRGRRPSLPQDLGAWLHLSGDGTAEFHTGKAEMGQNIRTSLTQVVAEELRLDPGRIRLVMADTDLTPWDAGTFGSMTTPVMAPQLRRVAATAREILIGLAAERWEMPRAELAAADGRITDGAAARSIAYGELVQGKKLVQSVSAAAPTTPATEWKCAGTSWPKVDGRNFVTGRHLYSVDCTLPGLLHGKVLRPPAFGAALTSLDETEARAMPGVRIVREGDFVGVTAPSEHLASRALAALRAEWRTTPQISDRDLFGSLRSAAPELADFPPREGARSLRRTYQVAFIAHAPLEPRAAVARWEAGKLTVWTGTQRPFGVRSDLAEAFGVPEGRVRVIVPDTGSAFGGKHTGEAALEAARLARAAGRPVKLVWTRNEEFTWAYFRPAGLIEISSRCAADGTLTGWRCRNLNSGPAALRAPYAISGQETEFKPAHSPLRQGSYRSLAAAANTFARETHVDEQARAAGIDPLPFRLHNLTEPRLRAVLTAAANAFGWDQARPGSGRGLAVGADKGSVLATCAEVAVDRTNGKVSVVRVVQAFECGAILNPEHLENLNEGAIIQGLGGALFEAIRFEDGRILNGHFAQYRVPRFQDMPRIKVVLVDRKDLPSAGAGETPIIGIAPALGNAIFDATAVRLRSLPLAPTGLPGWQGA